MLHSFMVWKRPTHEREQVQLRRWRMSAQEASTLWLLTRSRRWCLEPLREGRSDKGSNPSPPEQRICVLGYFMRARLQHHNVTNILTASSHNCILHMPQLVSCLTPPATTGPLQSSSWKAEHRISPHWAPSAHALSQLVPASSLFVTEEKETLGVTYWKADI